eukprot:10711923-Karenia_brevis.AAC.1
MGEVMENLRDANLEAVSRVGREMERPYRELNVIENVSTRSRWAPLALADRPPRPPAPVRANSDPRPPSAPARAPDTSDTVERLESKYSTRSEAKEESREERSIKT